jgi:hypothetical protein
MFISLIGSKCPNHVREGLVCFKHYVHQLVGGTRRLHFKIGGGGGTVGEMKHFCAFLKKKYF